MSVNLGSLPRQRSLLSRLRDLWPLWIFLALLASALHYIVRYWPQIVLQSAIWQKSLHQQMSNLLQMVEQQPHQAGLSLMMFSLVYGVLHAVGPGHGKVVIMTYLATHPSKLKSSLKLTLAASLVQGLMAIALVTVVLGILQLSSRTLHNSSFWMEKGSFVLVAGLGLLLCFRALKQLYIVLVRQPKPATILRVIPLPVTPLNVAAHGRMTLSPIYAPSHSLHQHDADCGCGHRHLPSNEELERGSSWRTRLMIVLAMGMRPCSGAIMVLLFSKVIGVYLWGVASALVMAAGTAITISALAVLVFYCRRVIERLGANRASPVWQRATFSLLSFAGGMILVGSGILLYLSAQPAMMGGIRPFSG
ncbi:nickel/cobalt transporter [Pectobacterium atrosepticum]|uniref:nickel/cobalt transporter n=1 Tax=Pectobacterium atrosepticum TaxID=29471 RepID=UPI0003A36194|nr:nickel/cobalt transporter [Pectobacterium atrosepticum]GKV84604.1 nickel/cobalt efflux system [Pectobacterium carotovorum subsp. carotovorum]AIA72069.1 nickel transporter [Pectobacterium atrosepticum]AIK15037.1 putative ABC-type nickel/cobalt efflux system, permease component [Pectobacterium atrosepticum]ATY91811.1 nickel transporter [Pectobacterium atrosepticum]KFX15158.1 nickel transporter [Pectobacterium atrosepticum]